MRLCSNNGELVLTTGLVNFDEDIVSYTIFDIKDLHLLQDFLYSGKKSSTTVINGWFFQTNSAHDVYINICDTVAEVLVRLESVQDAVRDAIAYQEISKDKADSSDFWKTIYCADCVDTLRFGLLEMLDKSEEAEFQHMVKDQGEMEEVLPLVRELTLYKRGWRGCDTVTPIRYESYTISEGVYLTLVGEMKKQEFNVYVIKLEFSAIIQQEILLSNRNL
jgi:hypothetical protein